MKVLELFSGTHSIGKVCKEYNFNVISLDRDLSAECPFGSGYKSENHIQADIMTWDYTIYPKGHFDLITASPSCFYWSPLRKTNYGKELKAHPGKIFSEKLLLQDIEDYGIPMVDKVFEIMDYYQPKFWWIENPKLGSMKDYINDLIPYIDVDYCRYGFDYKKPTRIWTNIKFKGLKCNHKKHLTTTTNGKGRGGGSNRLPRYVIPPKLIEDIIEHIDI
tara:strand:+ start:1302 stop:1958 length:657 start_codon:yes stop_codon:yes gene_type:complete